MSKRALQRNTTNDVINLLKYSETTSRTTYTRKILPNTISFIVKKKFKKCEGKSFFLQGVQETGNILSFGTACSSIATKAWCVHALNLACKLRRLLLNSSNHKNNFKTWFKIQLLKVFSEIDEVKLMKMNSLKEKTKCN